MATYLWDSPLSAKVAEHEVPYGPILTMPSLNGIAAIRWSFNG